MLVSRTSKKPPRRNPLKDLPVGNSHNGCSWEQKKVKPTKDEIRRHPEKARPDKRITFRVGAGVQKDAAVTYERVWDSLLTEDLAQLIRDRTVSLSEPHLVPIRLMCKGKYLKRGLSLHKQRIKNDSMIFLHTLPHMSSQAVSARKNDLVHLAPIQRFPEQPSPFSSQALSRTNSAHNLCGSGVWSAHVTATEKRRMAYDTSFSENCKQHDDIFI
jgi:hypothetical protein